MNDEVEKKILLAISYLKGLLNDAKRRGDEELVKYIEEVVKVYEGRIKGAEN